MGSAAIAIVQLAAFFVEEECQQDIPAPLRHGRGLVKQGAGENHGIARAGRIKVGSVLGKQQPTALVIFRVQVERECEAAVRMALHRVVSVRSKAAARIGVVTDHLELFDARDLAGERLLNFGYDPSIQAPANAMQKGCTSLQTRE